jgi:hypothetical protein
MEWEISGGAVFLFRASCEDETKNLYKQSEIIKIPYARFCSVGETMAKCRWWYKFCNMKADQRRKRDEQKNISSA